MVSATLLLRAFPKGGLRPEFPCRKNLVRTNKVYKIQTQNEKKSRTRQKKSITASRERGENGMAAKLVTFLLLGLIAV